MFLKISIAVGFPLLSLSLTDCLLLVNSLCHQNVVAQDTADSLKAFQMFLCFHRILTEFHTKLNHKHIDQNFFPQQLLH